MKRQIEGSIIPRCIKYNRDLDLYERVVMEALIDRENGLMKSEDAFYSYQTWLADNLGISLRKLKSSIKSLSEKGLITVSKGIHNKHQYNLYTINWDYIEEINDNFSFKKEEDKDMYEEELKEVEPIQIEETITNVVEDNEPVEKAEIVQEEPFKTFEEMPEDDEDWRILLNIVYKEVEVEDEDGVRRKERLLKPIGEASRYMNEYLSSHPEKTKKMSHYLILYYQEMKKAA